MFNCDPVTPSSGSSPVNKANALKDHENIIAALTSVTQAMFSCAGIVLTISAFLDPKQVIIPAILGYSFVLAGIAAAAVFMIKTVSHSPANTFNKMDKFRIGMVFFSLILLTSITISIYSKYKSQIMSGNVPQFQTFALLISLFICMQLYQVYKWIDTNNKLKSHDAVKVASTLSSMLLLYKLISYLLIICLSISLKYYVTDG